MSSLNLLEIECQDRRAPAQVLTGFDDSAGAIAAVEWATMEAAARGSSLRIAQSPSALRALIDDAVHADLLVLAASDDESASAVLFGSVARKAVRRSPCPVVVIRGSRSGPIRRIVVGVDGSNAAAAALDWACDEANLHNADLVVLHARERDIGQVEARCVLDLAVNECRDRTSVRVRGVLAEGQPATMLIEASRDAEIVAVGSRGRSGFRTALFGSVALSVAESADCPVAVTHPRMRLD